jgi:hypothetical protein
MDAMNGLASPSIGYKNAGKLAIASLSPTEKEPRKIELFNGLSQGWQKPGKKPARLVTTQIKTLCQIT